MPSPDQPQMILTANLWSLAGHPPGEDEWSFDRKAEAAKARGFDGVSWNAAAKPEFREICPKHGLRFQGACDLGSVEEMEEKIAAQIAFDCGPINCQVGDHDTPVEEAIELTVALMETSERLGAQAHLEMHRDTCTETPEKTYAIIEGVEKRRGKPPLVNFDYSHPAIVKHLVPRNYKERLIERPDVLQAATLLHIRPFNGHHCQIPITDGAGNFSPEFEAFRPFLRDLFGCWLEGPRPGGALWVVPELGPIRSGYGLSCFPNIWEDTVAAGQEFRRAWAESLEAAGG